MKHSRLLQTRYRASAFLAIAMVFVTCGSFGLDADAAETSHTTAAKGVAASWPANDMARRLHGGRMPDVLAATSVAGSILAVGANGAVLRSENGHAYRQARTPTRSTLTGVRFANAKDGWAVGYDGVVIATNDGGKSWSLQREAYGRDEVLLDVAFVDSTHGVAVGMFGIAIKTTDGGRSWSKFQLEAGDNPDRHLYSIIAVDSHVLVVSGESGLLYRSDDAGEHWAAVESPAKSSLWAVASSGQLVLGVGMGGTIVRSVDAGQNWSVVPTNIKRALSAVAFGPDGAAHVAGANGMALVSHDDARSFTASASAGAPSATALAVGTAGLVTFPSSGAVGPE